MTTSSSLYSKLFSGVGKNYRLCTRNFRIPDILWELCKWVDVVRHKHCSGEEGENPCIRNPGELVWRYRTNQFQWACGSLGKCDEKPWISSKGDALLKMGREGRASKISRTYLIILPLTCPVCSISLSYTWHVLGFFKDKLSYNEIPPVSPTS